MYAWLVVALDYTPLDPFPRPLGVFVGERFANSFLLVLLPISRDLWMKFLNTCSGPIKLEKKIPGVIWTTIVASDNENLDRGQ